MGLRALTRIPGPIARQFGPKTLPEDPPCI